MRSAAGTLAAACCGALSLAGLAAPATRAAIAFAPCPQSNEYACATLAVRLDPTGVSPGKVTLSIRRHRAPVGEARSAVVALAGGPGQAALPITEEFAEILGPILATRDLLVFDQRGTGESGALSCPAFEASSHLRSLAALVAACGAQLGPSRAFYTSLDSVADIEAIRVAGGYEKLVLYGTSYGTKVAELYAQEHPEHVEALLLDSVVPPEGPEPLNRATFAAIPRVLRELCERHACAHVTREPVADLSHVLARIRRGPLRGAVVDGRGHRHVRRIHSEALLDALISGDLAPDLRAEFITAVRAAAEHDTAPLARLLARGEPTAAAEGVDLPLYLATSCEEEEFPWSRTAAPAVRLQQARAAIEALPAAAEFPFRRANVLDLSDMPACAYWPFATLAPPALAGALPDVPTLILSGAEDLRTPTANAQAVAARIPDAHLLVVPDTGHSVLTAEPTQCAREALAAQFAGKAVKRCRATPTPAALRPPPLPPTRLEALSPVRGYTGRPGRTLHALALTFSDLSRQLGLQLVEMVAAGRLTSVSVLRSGGLRAGWMRYAHGAIALSGYSYVPGVSVSGWLGAEEAKLTIGGGAAAHGTLRLGRYHTLVGLLGTERVRIGTAGLRSAAASVAVGFAGSISSVPRAVRAHSELALDELLRSLDRLPAPAAHS